MSGYKQLLELYAPKVVETEVVVDGKRCPVFVKELSAAQVFSMQEKRNKMKNGETDNRAFAMELLSQALCNEDGSPAMTSAEASALASIKVQAFNALTQVVAEKVGLRKPEDEEEGAEGKA